MAVANLDLEALAARLGARTIVLDICAEANLRPLKKSSFGVARF